MKMIQLPLADASDEQIRDYCQVLDLDPAGISDREGLLALLSVAWDKDYVLVPQGTEANARQAGQTGIVIQQRLEGGIGSHDPKVVLKIGKTTHPGGKDPVPVSVNGRNLVLQRDQVIELPYRYYLALLNAQRAEVSQDMNTGDVTEDEFTNYPVSVLRFPSDEEIAAFHERTDDALMPA